MRTEDTLPTIEDLKATVAAEWDQEREDALNGEATARLRRLETRQREREQQQRHAEQARREAAEDVRLAQEVHRKMYPEHLAAALDPNSAYDLIHVSAAHSGGFLAFGDSKRAAEVREWLVTSALYGDPERQFSAVSGIELGQFCPAGELIAVNPSNEDLQAIVAEVTTEQQQRLRQQSDRVEAAQREAEAEHQRRRFGAPVGRR